MIKFFGKFRQRLLLENKFSKYLLYATGEIILIVIGILIALQINNWNQKSLLKKEEVKLIHSLKEEFKKNLDRFDEIILLRNKQLDAKDFLLQNHKGMNINKMDSFTLIAGYTWTYDPATGIYDAIINSGKIELISNDSLKIQLANFKSILQDYQYDELSFRDFLAKTFSLEMLNNWEYQPLNFYRNRNKEEELRDKEKFDEMLDSEKVQSYFSMMSIFAIAVEKEEPKLRAEMVSIIEILDSESIKLK